jgi:hypothetical protein
VPPRTVGSGIAVEVHVVGHFQIHILAEPAALDEIGELSAAWSSGEEEQSPVPGRVTSSIDSCAAR